MQLNKPNKQEKYPLFDNLKISELYYVRAILFSSVSMGIARPLLSTACLLVALLFEFGGLLTPSQTGFNLFDPRYAKLKPSQVSVPRHVAYTLCLLTGISVIAARRYKDHKLNWNSLLVYINAASLLLIIVNSAQAFSGAYVIFSNFSNFDFDELVIGRISLISARHQD